MSEPTNTLPYGTGDNRRQTGTMPLKGAVGARPPGGFQRPSWGNAGSGSSGVGNAPGMGGRPTFSGTIPEDVRRRIQQAVAGRQQGGPASGGGPSGMPGFGPGGKNDLGGGGWMGQPKPGPDPQPGPRPLDGTGAGQPYRPQPGGGTGPKDSGDPFVRLAFGLGGPAKVPPPTPGNPYGPQRAAAPGMTPAPVATGPGPEPVRQAPRRYPEDGGQPDDTPGGGIGVSV